MWPSQPHGRHDVVHDEASELAAWTQQGVVSEESSEGDVPCLLLELGRCWSSELLSTQLEVAPADDRLPVVVEDAGVAVAGGEGLGKERLEGALKSISSSFGACRESATWRKLWQPNHTPQADVVPPRSGLGSTNRMQQSGRWV